MSHKKKSPEFYEYYPKLFHDYFPDIDKVTIDLLSKAGFYFYQSILQLDAVIDNQENHRIFNVLDLQENAIKILSTIYEDGNNFWNLWETRKREFRKAISLEKNLWNNPSEENYNKVADMKSAFGKVAIDSLFIFSENSNNSEIYNLLLESHKYFSIGFQLYDDIIDFTEDFNKKQFNWAVYELSKTLDFSKYKYDVNILNKLFYIDGTSVILFEKSIYYLEKAKKVIEKLPPDSLWLDTICDFEKTILQTKDSVNGYVKTIEEKANTKRKLIQEDYFFDFNKVTIDFFFKGLQFIKSDFLQNYVVLKHLCI